MPGGVDDSRASPLRAGGAPGLELVAAAGCAATLAVAACGALVGGSEIGEGPLPCPFRAVTGLPCPFCGMTHSLLALGAGDMRESVELNPIGPAVLLLAGVGLWGFGRAALARARVRLPRGALVLVLTALAAAWTLQLVEVLA
jgi:hypothetical protein